MAAETTFKYQEGSITIESKNINELKEFALEMLEMANESGRDLPKHLLNICNSIEYEYQQYHNLDEHNWDVVH